MTSVDNDVVLIVDDSKLIAHAYARVLLGIESSLPATVKLGFLLLSGSLISQM